MEKYIGVKPSERKFSPKKEKSPSIMHSFEQQMRSKPSFMFQSPTQRGLAEPRYASPGPQDYATVPIHLMKKDFSRPKIAITQPTRNLDGAIRTELYIHSNELKHKNLSPGPAPSLDFPQTSHRNTQRAEPRMHQYGLNMITNTLPDPDQLKTNNEVAKAQLKKRLQVQ